MNHRQRVFRWRLAFPVAFFILLSTILSGVLVARAYYAEFKVSIPSFSLGMNQVSSMETGFDIEFNPGTYEGYSYTEGEAPYRIMRFPKYEYDSVTDTYSNVASLCPYIGFIKTDYSEILETSLPPAPLNSIDRKAIGRLDAPVDTLDSWKLVVVSPCFEGECPAGYDPELYGNPLPQSQKGKTFYCDVSVESQEQQPIFQVLDIFPGFVRRAFAWMPMNTIEVSATFTGEIIAPPACTENCNSSVLFLPGLQASRLYRPDYDRGTDRLWEPNTSSDVTDLYMKPDGESIREDIYAENILDEAFGVGPDVYKSFIGFMNELKQQDAFVDWAAVPYDWRYPVDAILNRGSLRSGGGYTFHETLGATTSPIIFQELNRLASNSRTGKVTLIAHSNGGLIAKALMFRLEELGLTGLVDKVVLIGSPQLGTPKAIASLLHGEGQDIRFGILNKSTARGLAVNMPGAYQLLPSNAYFDIVQEAPILFREKTSTRALFNAYGANIDTYPEMEGFLVGDDGRLAPPQNDWETPALGNASLLTSAKELHSRIDSWLPPEGVELIQIAGWGLDTIKGIRYTERYSPECGCNRITYVPVFTQDGDETVVTPSALATPLQSNSKRYWIRIPAANEKYETNWKHSNLTEVIPLQELLEKELAGTNALTPDFVVQERPVGSGQKIRYTLHSPLSLGLYDEEGRYTGMASSSPETDNFSKVIEEIPNSDYVEFGETKIIGAPEKGASSVRMVGEGTGTFTLVIERLLGDETVATTTFQDIPVATGTLASLSVSAEGPMILLLDMDADGRADVALDEGGFDEKDAIALLRSTIARIDVLEKKRNNLLRAIDRIERVYEREYKREGIKDRRLGTILGRIEKRIASLNTRGKILTSDAENVLRVLVILRNEMIK